MIRHVKDGRMGAGGVEVHQVARQHDLLSHGRIRRGGGLDDEADLGALFTADQVDDLAQLHADDLDGFIAVLRDRDDLVVRLEPRIEIGRTAGDDFLHHAVVLLEPKQGADADELQAHLDAKVLVGVGGEVRRVRVVQLRDIGEKEFAQILAFEVGEVLEHALVALPDARARFLDGLVVENFLEQLKAQPLVPQRVGVFAGGRPFGF